MGLFNKKNKETIVFSPIKGTLKTLDSLKDGVFSAGMMGPGVAITPRNGKVYAPIAGVMATVFPTGHAYGIVNKKGVAILIHIGLDTVNLKGEGFTAKVKQGQKVNAGALICEFDLDFVSKNAPSADVIVLATPETKGEIEKLKIDGLVTLDTELFVIK